MLALSTTKALSFMDSAVLKNAPSSVLSTKPFSSPPTASVWSPDNATLFVAFQDSIHQYSPSGSQISEIYSGADGITSLIVKDNDQVIIFSESNNIHVLKYGSGSGKVTQTFTSHKSPVNALSLSNDSTLLASVSSSAAHVHNLSLGSHTVLRGLPQSSGQITTCAFHLHSRTRILLGQGKQILIYDTTRPSGPVKVIPMSDAGSGDIVAVACSPFSKTLIAVATSGGNVGLIDLDKEKGLFRTLNLKVPLTSASFSPEGAALYFGTENGKLLILDLRSLDKPPKCVNVGEGGCRIECMSFQKKVKVTPDAKAKLASSTSVKPTPQPESVTTTTGSITRRIAASKTVLRGGTMTGSPARAGVRKGSTTATTTVTKGAASEKSGKPKAAAKGVFSPVRDPLGNIIAGVEPLGSLSKKIAKYENGSLARNNEREKEPRPSSRISITRGASSRSSSSLGISRTRTRAGSTASRADSALSTRRTDRPASRADSSISSPDLPTPCTISAFSKQTTTNNDQDLDSDSGMPSPELPPTVVADPVTPVPMAKKRVGMGVLGLGTPEVKKWIEAGKGKGREDVKRKGNGRRVGFKEISTKEDEGGDDEDAENAEAEETQRNLSMQISPRRVPPAWVQTASHAQTAIPSPLRTLSASPSPSSASAAHNLLRSIIADVMYDYQRDTKTEMMGLHLDLVRMGRGLRKELRDVAEGGVGGLAELERLREENRLLREENERLRRGY